MIRAVFDGEFAGWRTQARKLVLQGIPPMDVRWADPKAHEQFGFALDSEPATPFVPQKEFKVDPEFLSIAERVASVRDDSRWDLLYRVLYRLRFENPHLLKVAVDEDVLQLHNWSKAIGRDVHKMHAFVRFKLVVDENGVERYLAWHKPEHLILKLAAPFFARRFGDKPWSIFTPDLSAHYSDGELTYGEGLEQHLFAHADVMDEIWQTYYRSIFNPARIKLKAMTAEMPMKYWSSLPEAKIIRELIAEAPERLSQMAKMQKPEAEVPKVETLAELKKAASKCTACPLFERASQTVFGEGPETAELMIVGEQPGDQEDLAGHPFVGPAGEVLDRALLEAGFDRAEIYVTNAVKHFKWEERGKTRLHKKPSGAEMHACRPWLEAEVEKVKPKLLLLLGATAGTAWLGRLPKVTAERGRILKSDSHTQPAVLSWHPSAILRSMSEAEKQERYTQLVEDLKLAKKHLSKADSSRHH